MAQKHLQETDRDMDKFIGVLRDLERRTAELEKMVRLIPAKRTTAVAPVLQR